MPRPSASPCSTRPAAPLTYCTAGHPPPLLAGADTLGGTHELTVDLAGVTHLASAAVAVLHRARGLRLHAPPGTVAQHILTLVDLPYSTSK